VAGVQAVCILLDIKPSRTKDEAGQAVVDFWKPSVALMNERDFLGRLRGYDKDAIPPRVIEVRHGLCRALPAVRVKKIGRNEESPVGMGASMREGGAAQAGGAQSQSALAAAVGARERGNSHSALAAAVGKRHCGKPDRDGHQHAEALADDHYGVRGQPVQVLPRPGGRRGAVRRRQRGEGGGPLGAGRRGSGGDAGRSGHARARGARQAPECACRARGPVRARDPHASSSITGGMLDLQQ